MDVDQLTAAICSYDPRLRIQGSIPSWGAAPESIPRRPLAPSCTEESHMAGAWRWLHGPCGGRPRQFALRLQRFQLVRQLSEPYAAHGDSAKLRSVPASGRVDCATGSNPSLSASDAQVRAPGRRSPASGRAAAALRNAVLARRDERRTTELSVSARCPWQW